MLRTPFLAAFAFPLLAFSARAAEAPAPPAEATSVVPAALAGALPVLPASAAGVEQWRALRFGMFIHWGPVSLTGKELSWSRGAGTPVETYDNLYKRFDPQKFNADEWVAIAKAAGMKYIVLTAKHHDGFCLWDTKFTDYNIMHTPFRRDVVKELAEACRKGGIAFGVYYSVCDWHHPDFPRTGPSPVRRKVSNLDAYNKYLLAQTEELLTKYGPIVTLWNDVPQEFRGRGKNTLALARKLQPDILVSNRTGDGGDYDTPEQAIGGFNRVRPWESCMTVSAHNRWAWGGEKDGVKSRDACLRMLILANGGDGNVLLDVGPTPEGLIAPEQANLLKEVGEWLSKYGESLHGTRGGPWRSAAGKASTCKGKTVYIHLVAGQGEVFLREDGFAIVSAKLLTGGELESVREEGGMHLRIPEPSRNPTDTIIKLELDHDAQALPVRFFLPSWVAKTTASNIYRADPAYGPEQAVDGDPETRWAADAGRTPRSLEITMSRPSALKGVRVDEASGERIRSWTLSVRSEGAWTKVAEGTTLGKNRSIPFKATGDALKFEILEATHGPSIAEFTPLFDSQP